MTFSVQKYTPEFESKIFKRFEERNSLMYYSAYQVRPNGNETRRISTRGYFGKFPSPRYITTDWYGTPYDELQYLYNKKKRFTVDSGSDHFHITFTNGRSRIVPIFPMTKKEYVKVLYYTIRRLNTEWEIFYDIDKPYYKGCGYDEKARLMLGLMNRYAVNEFATEIKKYMILT